MEIGGETTREQQDAHRTGQKERRQEKKYLMLDDEVLYSASSPFEPASSTAAERPALNTAR